MSLISVIVSAAIGSVVVLGMTQFQVNLMRSIAQVKKASNLEILHSDILRHLAIKETCSEEPSPTNVQVGKSCIFKSPCDLLLAGVTKAAAYKQNKDEIKDKVTFTSASNDKDSTDTSTTSAANIYEKSEKYHDLRFVGMKVDKEANANKADLFVYFSTKQSNILLPDEYITIDLAIEYNTNGTLKRCYAKGGAVGANASLDCITIDDDSTTGKTLIGCGGTSDISANYNTFVGFGAGKSTELGSYGQGQGNSFFGYRAGYTNRSGRLNNFFGYQAGFSNTTGYSNTFIGWQAGYKNNSGTGNNFIGYHAGNKNTSGSYNNFFGRFAGSKNTSGRYNSFFGSGAGQHNTSGSNNIYIGNEITPPNSSGTKAGISRTASNQLNIGDLILGKRNPTAIPADNSNTPNENKITSITESSGVLIRGSLRCTEEPCGSEKGSCRFSQNSYRSWTINGNSCRASQTSLITIPHGRVHILNNTEDGFFGQRTLQCLDGSITSLGSICESKSSGGATYTYAFHSQTTTIPSCPTGFTSLWTGYSSVGGHDHQARANLSEIGSCLEKYVPMAWVECGRDWGQVCDHITPGDASLWLSTRPDSIARTSTTNDNVSSAWTSRCRACEGNKPIIARHSMTTSSPNCPTGWTSLWTGYSYAGGGTNDFGMHNDHLSGPGSCLKIFRPTPTNDCYEGRCWYKSGGDWTSYLATTTANGRDSAQTNILNLISRCRVCMKD